MSRLDAHFLSLVTPVRVHSTDIQRNHIAKRLNDRINYYHTQFMGWVKRFSTNQTVGEVWKLLSKCPKVDVSPDNYLRGEFPSIHQVVAYARSEFQQYFRVFQSPSIPLDQKVLHLPPKETCNTFLSKCQIIDMKSNELWTATNPQARASLFAPCLGIVNQTFIQHRAEKEADQIVPTQFANQACAYRQSILTYVGRARLSRASKELESIAMAGDNDVLDVPLIPPFTKTVRKLPDQGHAVWARNAEQKSIADQLRAEYVTVQQSTHNSEDWLTSNRAKIGDRIDAEQKRAGVEKRKAVAEWFTFLALETERRVIRQARINCRRNIQRSTERIRRVRDWLATSEVSRFVPETHRKAIEAAFQWTQSEHTGILDEKEDRFSQQAHDRVHMRLKSAAVVFTIAAYHWDQLASMYQAVDEQLDSLNDMTAETRAEAVREVFNSADEAEAKASRTETEEIKQLMAIQNRWGAHVSSTLQKWVEYIRGGQFQIAADQALTQSNEILFQLTDWMRPDEQAVSATQLVRWKAWAARMNLNQQYQLEIIPSLPQEIAAGQQKKKKRKITRQLCRPLQELAANVDAHEHRTHLGRWMEDMAFIFAGVYFNHTELKKLT